MNLSFMDGVMIALLAAAVPWCIASGHWWAALLFVSLLVLQAGVERLAWWLVPADPEDA